MRISSLKSLVLPVIQGAPTLESSFGAQSASVLTLFVVRTPSLGRARKRPLIKVLDKGFFFPVSTPWRAGSLPFRGLVIRSKDFKGPTLKVRRKRSVWEVLEGGESSVVREKSHAWPKSRSHDYSSSPDQRAYGGARPQARRGKRWRLLMAFLRRRRARRLKAANLIKPKKKKRRKLKKVWGFKRALRLLPKRRRKVRSYRYLKNIRPRKAIRRGVRASFLRTGLLWSRKFNKTNKKFPNAGLRALLPRLSASNPSPLLGEPRIAARFAKRPGQKKSRRTKIRRILQTRYKPGLSKAWRLLRMQFCLAWALPWLRQRRFTNYVSQLSQVTGLNFLKMCISSIGFVVRATSIVISRSFGGKAFVNGIFICNPFYQLYKGDRVAVLPSPLGLPWRWKTFTDNIRIKPLRGWEVDGLTRSVTLWSEVSVRELRSFAFLKPMPFLTFRMYNWKYRH